MKLVLSFVLILLTCNGFGQTIHHQMISSQGKTSTTNEKAIVKQTIGQLSVTGSYKGLFSVQQGFQQSLWGNYLKPTKNIHVSTLPNPFTEIVNFNFNNTNSGNLTVKIFDVSGKILFIKELQITNNQCTLNLSRLAIGTYLVKLIGKEFNYYTKIIKI